LRVSVSGVTKRYGASYGADRESKGNGMERSSAPIIGIAVIVAIATSVYAYMMRGELMQQKAAVAVAEKKLADLNRTVEDANRKSETTKASLDTCSGQLADTQAQLDAMLKPAPRVKRQGAAPSGAPTPE
jgi:hypothetical protein